MLHVASDFSEVRMSDKFTDTGDLQQVQCPAVSEGGIRYDLTSARRYLDRYLDIYLATRYTDQCWQLHSFPACVVRRRDLTHAAQPGGSDGQETSPNTATELFQI